MGFETVVRPVVFPNIRPQRAQSLPPQDDPEKGFAEIKGSGGQHIDLTYSMNASVQISRPRERKRQVDVVRINQKGGPLVQGLGPSLRTSPRAAGNINRNNFVDLEIATKIWSDAGSNRLIAWYQSPKPADNIDILTKGKIVRADD